MFAVGIGLRGKIGNGGDKRRDGTASLESIGQARRHQAGRRRQRHRRAPARGERAHAGEHSITYEGGDRDTSQKSKLKLEAREVRQLDPGGAQGKTGAATFDVKTPGATIALVSGDERRTLSDISHPIEVENPKSWTLEASKPGYETLRLPVSFEDLGPTRLSSSR